MKILGILLALFGGASLILPRFTDIANIAFTWMGTVGTQIGIAGNYISWAFVGLGVLLLIVGMMKGSSSDM